MDGKSQPNEIRIMALNKGPVDGGGKQVRDRLKLAIPTGTIQFESLPGPDAWQELYAKQIRQGEDVGRLPVRIGIESGGVNFTERILKNVENVGRLVYSAPNEATDMFYRTYQSECGARTYVAQDEMAPRFSVFSWLKFATYIPSRQMVRWI